jgi:hypothetical protein
MAKRCPIIPDWPKEKLSTREKTRRPKQPRVCFQTKRDALKVFADANQHVLQSRGGGLYDKDSSGGFDAINHAYDLTGRCQVNTMAKALWVALPRGSAAPKYRPYCLTNIDIKTLNDLPVAAEAGGFRQPDHVYEAGIESEEEAYYRSRQ